MSKAQNFNSIKVRLEPCCTRPKQSLILNFNSIKVRLEPENSVTLAVDKLFQFHKGAIRTIPSQRQNLLGKDISIP